VPRWAEGASVAGFGLIALSLSIFLIEDRDIGFHLRAGELIWQSGQIPTEDPFSYIAEGRPWVDSHWLFQLLVHGGYSLSGFTGLVALRIVAVTALLGALFAACHRRDYLPVTLLLGLIATFASFERFSLRPDLYTLTFLAIFVAGSERLSSRPRVWFVVLPALQVVWTNAHGLHLLGPVYLALRFVGEALDVAVLRLGLGNGRGEIDPASLRQRGLLALLCALASMLNANGVPGILYPYQLFLELRGEVTWFPPIAELQPTVERRVQSILDPVVSYWVLVGLTVAASWRHFRFGNLLPGAAFLYLSLEAVRNVPLFAVVALPVVGHLLRALASRAGSRLPVSPRAAGIATAFGMSLAAAATVFGATSGALYDELRWPRSFGIGGPVGIPSDEMLERLRANPGRILNDPNLGGFLIWKLYPQKQVAADGRWEVYGERLSEVRMALHTRRRFLSFVDLHQVGAVVIDRRVGGVRSATRDVMSRVSSFRLTVQTPSTLLYERIESRSEVQGPLRGSRAP
jgi:hypothetical protein